VKDFVRFCELTAIVDSQPVVPGSMPLLGARRYEVGRAHFARELYSIHHVACALSASYLWTLVGTPVVHSSLIGCTSCIVKSCGSRSSFILSPLWTP